MLARNLCWVTTKTWILSGWLAVGVMMAACGDGTDTPTATPLVAETPGETDTPTATPLVAETPGEEEAIMAFSVSSDAFAADQAIPSRFTCDGEDVSPALTWSDAPQGTQAYALIMDDPDAPGGVFTHWVLFNLPTGLQDLPEGVAKTERPESGGFQGRNDFDEIGYGGPCPPTGAPHRYNFTLYALDGLLDPGPGAPKQQVLEAMQDHILGEARLTGTYQR